MHGRSLLGIWAVATIAIGICLSFLLFADAAPWAAKDIPIKAVFSPGTTTNGHYQIEDRCDLCHTPFGGVQQESCLDCHQEELAAARDTHAPGIFSGVHAQHLRQIDARRCVTCHTEHQPEITGRGGVTVSGRFCRQCHERITRTSASHVGLTFDMCLGCHNYHDNRVLEPGFRQRHDEMPDILEKPRLPTPGGRSRNVDRPRSRPDADPPAGVEGAGPAIANWEHSSHATAGINCTDCHARAGQDWQQVVTHETCADCHARTTTEFLQGREGMRLAHGLPPITPVQARLPMREESHHLQLNCSACHAPHGNDTPALAVETCLSCHDSRHSRAYLDSPHHRLWQAEVQGTAPPGTGVSCATCHYPREQDQDGVVHTAHNVSRDLRPNEKMAASVCMHCHGLPFALRALTDRQQVLRNFRRPLLPRVKSIEDWLDAQGSLLSPGPH